MLIFIVMNPNPKIIHFRKYLFVKILHFFMSAWGKTCLAEILSDIASRIRIPYFLWIRIHFLKIWIHRFVMDPILAKSLVSVWILNPVPYMRSLCTVVCISWMILMNHGCCFLSLDLSGLFPRPFRLVVYQLLLLAWITPAKTILLLLLLLSHYKLILGSKILHLMLQMPWNQFVDRQHFDTVPDPQTLNGANLDPCETNIPDLAPTVLYTVYTEYTYPHIPYCTVFN